MAQNKPHTPIFMVNDYVDVRDHTRRGTRYNEWARARIDTAAKVQWDPLGNPCWETYTVQLARTTAKGRPIFFSVGFSISDGPGERIRKTTT